MRTLFFLFLFSVSLFSSPLALDKGWEYRLGDDLSWAVNAGEEKEWKPIVFPNNPRDRNGATNVWYRISVPDQRWRDPALFITSIDLIGEIYLEGKRIYKHGSFDEEGKGNFIGWPWHLVDLPEDIGGKTLYFRIYSNYLDLGLWGDIEIASKSHHLENLIKGRDGYRFVIGFIAVFIGLMFVFTFFYSYHEKANLFLGFLIITQGMDIIVSSKITQLYFYMPLLSQYILAFCYFFFPVGMALLLEQITFKKQISVIRSIWSLHLIYLLVGMTLAIMGVINLSTLYVPFDTIYYFVTMPLIIYFAYRETKSGNKDVRLFFIGFVLLVGSYVYNALISYGVLEWMESPTHFFILFFLICLSAIIVGHYTNTKEIEKKNSELNSLQNSLLEKNRILESLSQTDHLTKLYNRLYLDNMIEKEVARSKRYHTPFSVIVLDIDHFKKVNDTYGHQVGDQVLIDMASVLEDNTREIDTVGRWGGEEFLILLPETTLPNALKVAEKLREAIQLHDFVCKEKQSASFGVAMLHEDEAIHTFISRVDKAMYQSKKNGRNRVESEDE